MSVAGRGASGWQQEYDRKRNAQRKPIMDAMKAAIRQEDMAKGIYTHVADLPHQEPKRVEIQVRTAS